MNTERKDYDPDRKWIIEVTEQQLYDIINDVEDIHRFLCGQTYLFNATGYVTPCTKVVDLRDKLEELQSLVTPELEQGVFYNWCGSGCPNEARREKIKRGYAIYRNLYHCIEKFRDRDEWNVYQSETLTCGVPLAICYPKPTYKKIDTASTAYGTARIKDHYKLTDKALLHEHKQLPIFDAYDLETAFEKGAEFALNQQ